MWICCIYVTFSWNKQSSNIFLFSTKKKNKNQKANCHPHTTPKWIASRGGCRCLSPDISIATNEVGKSVSNHRQSGFNHSTIVCSEPQSELYCQNCFWTKKQTTDAIKSLRTFKHSVYIAILNAKIFFFFPVINDEIASDVVLTGTTRIRCFKSNTVITTHLSISAQTQQRHHCILGPSRNLSVSTKK